MVHKILETGDLKLLGGDDDKLLAEVNKLLDTGDLKLVGGDGDKRYTLPPRYLPPWFGPHAILKEVERLVVNDNENAAQGWTRQEIRKSLMQTHGGQQEIEPLDLFDDMLQMELDELLDMGDLKVVGVGGENRYTLSPPYLPEWFGPEAVLQAVGELDKSNTGGSTLQEIRGFFKDKPLPPHFDTVLRTMLSVAHKTGHLTIFITRGADGSQRRNYTRRHAPAPAPDYVWWYFLIGYKLSVSGGLDDDSDSDVQIMHEVEKDALSLKENNRNAPPWIGAGTVLQEIEHLVVDGSSSIDDDDTSYFEGWTCEQIRNSLMQTHKQEQGLDLDNEVRRTLVTFSKRGYLKTTGAEVDKPRYTLSITPRCFPSWFGPKAVLNAVEVFDENNKDASGSTWRDIKGYFISMYDRHHSQLPCLNSELLQNMLSVLRHRGHLTWGTNGREYYTRRLLHAPASVDDIPNYNLLWYYVGYRQNPSRRSYGMDCSAVGEAAHDVRVIRQRRVNNDDSSDDTDDETKTLLPKRIQEDAKKKKREKMKQQRMWYMLCRVGLSLIGHGILLGVSFIPGFEEKTCGDNQEKTFKKWLKWALMDLMVPIAVLILIFIIQIFLDHDLEDDISQRTPKDKKRVKRNKLVNLGMLAASKLFYVAIIEAPGPKIPLRISAHIVAFVIDMIGAIYLWRKHSGLDLEMLDISSKVD